MKTLNYAIRFLLRTKSYTIINLLGLAFSLACCIILLRYIHRELTVDIHCIDRNRVYGVQTTFEGNRVLSVAEIGDRDSVYIDNSGMVTRSRIVLLENDYLTYQSNRIPVHAMAADSAYFELFPYHVLQGSASLEDPASVLLMESFAEKLFGKQNPIGKILTYSNGKEIRVTGILEEPVNKRMFNFDLVLSSKLSSLWERMPLDFIRFTSETEVMKANKAGSYFSRNEEVVLHANANLPNGSTLEQMNTLIKRMEAYLSEFKEIKQFQTSVESARRASIHIYFAKEHQKSGFPYTLKANMISKALQLGGGNWSIYGLQDQGFSNDVRENAGSFRVKMYGYNYDELYDWVEKLKAKLLSHRRIREVTISSDFSWWKDDYMEFYFNLNKQRMAEEGIGAGRLFSAIHPIYGRNMEIGSVMAEEGTEKIKLSSRQSEDRDVWAMQFYPFQIGEREYKLSELATVEKGQMPQEVAKENQQYRLCLQYEYIGSSEQGNKLLKKDLEEFNEILPMGYTAKSEDNNWSWGGKDNKQYRLLLIVIAIIFFITSILFNSLKQPLAILFVIPVSYIGVFLTFYWFKLNFDQGGFASFVLLCGITVNASIYILNEYNSVRKRFPRLSPLRAYVKAWNTKVIPIFLTVTSTILGFVPFMVGMEKEGFWFPLAAGTIGGLIMSVIGVFIFLPVFTLKKKCLVKPKAML